MMSLEELKKMKEIHPIWEDETEIDWMERIITLQETNIRVLKRELIRLLKKKISEEGKEQ